MLNENGMTVGSHSVEYGNRKLIEQPKIKSCIVLESVVNENE